MNATHTRLAVLLALSALALVACGGSSTESLVGPAGDAATLSAADKHGPEAPAGDGVCEGCDGTGPGPGDGTCDGCEANCDCICAGDNCECACEANCDCTCDGDNCECACDGTGPGPGDGTCDGCEANCDCICAGDNCECACDGTGPHGPGDSNG